MSSTDTHDDDDGARDAILDEVVAAGAAEPVGTDRADLRRWRAHDLASMVEGAFGVQVDPEALLDGRASGRWLRRLRRSYRPPPLFDDRPAWLGLPCWLLDDRRRVGTVALGSMLGAAWLPLHSLYVAPPARGGGVATRALDALARASARHGLAGVRLGTHWTWQRSLRFYLARGFWVVGWKRDISLVLEPALPRYRFVIDGDEARLEVERGGRLDVALTARRRDGDLLQIRRAAWLGARSRLHLEHCARCTFAVNLAVSGWPLVRSEADWARRHGWSDGGEPEGLAYKIGVFERLARDDGWRVETPRVPGLDRWQAWERGEEHGRREVALDAIRIVLDRRGLHLDEVTLAGLHEVDDFWTLEDLLGRAVTAPTLTAWWEGGRRG